jgi:hypothetical protein
LNLQYNQKEMRFHRSLAVGVLKVQQLICLILPSVKLGCFGASHIVTCSKLLYQASIEVSVAHPLLYSTWKHICCMCQLARLAGYGSHVAAEGDDLVTMA